MQVNILVVLYQVNFFNIFIKTLSSNFVETSLSNDIPLGESESVIENCDDSVDSYEPLQCTKEESEEKRSDPTDSQSSSDSDLDKDDSASLFYGSESADPVCVKLNHLKSPIFY